jgi:HD-like signal output (HDOD) protein
MPVDAALRTLAIDVPSQPDALMRLSLLLAEDEVDLQAVTALVEADMALAAAVLKAVNSSMYGINGRVQSVHQALNYLGTREVVAVAFEMGLRAVFPSAPELDAIWSRATVRGFLMGRLAQALGLDAWAAHSAGLFEECGKAVLFKHASQRYRPLLAQAQSDEDLLGLEHDTFGVSHDALGAALCETWGLAAPAVHSVRYHTMVQATRQLPMHVPRRAVCLLSALAHAMVNERQDLEPMTRLLAPQADLDAERVWLAASQLHADLQALPG